MDFSELARSRHSVKTYDPSVEISDAALEAIFEDVILSPSSYNLQHWRFVVVRDSARKLKLQAAAYGQTQVGEASAVVLVCGKLNAHEDAPVIHGNAPPAVRERVVGMIEGFYADNDRLQRDEAIRSGSLAAMSLMYAAKARGFDTGPMIGFDSEAVAQLLEIPDNCLPVMMVVLGQCRGSLPERRGRWPLDRVVRLESMSGQRLESAKGDGDEAGV